MTLRLSPEDRDRLNEIAAARGLSMQAYLESIALGREPQIRRSGRRRPSNGQETLPMTG